MKTAKAISKQLFGAKYESVMKFYPLPYFHLLYCRCHVADVKRQTAYGGLAGTVHAPL